MKEPEISLVDVPDRAKHAMPAKWARDTRFYLCMEGLYAVRPEGTFKWGRGWKACPRPDCIPKDE